MGAGGRPHGSCVRPQRRARAWRLAPPHELAWALARFEMGCERASRTGGAERPPAGAAGAAGAGGSGQRAARRPAGGAVRRARGARRLDAAGAEGGRAGARGDHWAPPSSTRAAMRWWRSSPAICGRCCATSLRPPAPRSRALVPTRCWPRRNRRSRRPIKARRGPSGEQVPSDDSRDRRDPARHRLGGARGSGRDPRAPARAARRSRGRAARARRSRRGCPPRARPGARPARRPAAPAPRRRSALPGRRGGRG